MIEIKNISKKFGKADGMVEALKDVSLSIPDGDIFGIIGMSGAGKSTLVRCINMLERPDSGTIEIDGCDLGKLSEKELRAIRRDITMIFQGFNLLMQRNCLKNVCFPLELAGVKKAEAKKKALELLEIVGLGIRQKHTLPNYQAVSNKELRLPVRLQQILKSCFAMKQQVHLTQQQPIRFWN